MCENEPNVKHNKNKKVILNIIPFVAVVIVIGIIGFIGFQKVIQSLYEERASNYSEVVYKIRQNMETVITNYWNNTESYAEILEQMDFDDLTEARNCIGAIDYSLTQDDARLVLVDNKGFCHPSVEDKFKFRDISMLADDTHSRYVLVSTAPTLGKISEQMFFLVKLEQELKFSDTTITHLCMIVDMSSLDPFFQSAELGHDSAMFVIHKDGRHVYRQKTGNELSNIFNIIAMLEKWEFKYKTDSEETIRNIENGERGVACVVIDGKNYYAGYCPMEINDWIGILLMPEDEISTNSREFMGVIIGYMGIMAVCILVFILAILIGNSRRAIKQQEQLNEQLRRAADAERSANDAKTAFLSSMSHDIRTPMNTIIGMTTIAGRHIDDKEQVKSCLSKINLAGNHLLTLINDILDISKIESGKMALNPVTFSLVDSVENLINIIRPQIKSKMQDFDVHISQINHEYLYADELRINQIFINILTNAVKYTPVEGKIVLELYEELLKDRENLVRLTYRVKDTGIGMSEEYMATMYESFTRAVDTRVDKIQGSGLGLAICKQMVDLMGGEILCESKLGEGTIFTVILEIAIADKKEEEFMLPDMQFLLVDDDETFLQTSSETLKDMGACVDLAGNGVLAVEMAVDRHEQGKDYSVIIIDWVMPEMDGIEIAREIREKVGEDVLIILTSAYDSVEMKEAAKENGINGFISKPFFKSTLYRHMHKYLDLPEIEETAEEDAYGDFAGMKILVAEDNDMNWEIASELLDMYGIETERAENGKVCVEKINKAADGEFDAILMDVQMPIMNGREATGQIRKSDREYVRTIPIFAMTADAFAEDIAVCLEAGMDGHIPKPIDMAKLFKELRGIKNRNKSLI